MQPFILEGTTLRLDQPTEADIAAIAVYCQDPVLEYYMTLPWPYTLGDASAFVGEYGAHAWESGSEFSWAIREIDEGPLLGMIGYRTALSDVGFWLGKPHHGKGMMSAAVRLVAAKLFDMGITSEIGWECVVGNLASMAVARKSGFAFTGIDPRGLRHATGRIRNPGMQC